MAAIGSSSYFAKLNADQRRAVEHGVGDTADAPCPLLVIAGAGSGKPTRLRIASRIWLSTASIRGGFCF